MSSFSLSFLRPYLYRTTRVAKPEYARAYRLFQRRSIQSITADHLTGPHDVEKQKRLDQLRRIKPLHRYHPRLKTSSDVQSVTVEQFNESYNDIKETGSDVVSVFGRVRSIRSLGSKLIFIDIERDAQRLQVMVETQKLVDYEEHAESYRDFKKVARIGDWISVIGNPTKTSTGHLSILALHVPQILAPCLHHIPDKIDNPETLARRPHVHQLTSNEPGDILRLRAMIYDYIRTYFIQSGFLEVETPMFDINAGGAIARPFETIANELSNMPVRLRIAPELNLKRLIIGGQDKIFEMGRSFRNEGVDSTHNPEFSTCEFYEVGATLTDVVARTEQLVHGLYTAIEALRPTYFPSITSPQDINLTPPFRHLPFIPTIERASGQTLPNLSSPTAHTDLLTLLATLYLPLPTNPTLPRLLDTLAEHFIEPLCEQPTFITAHPEALSPLAKSYVDMETGQRVAARVELFIRGREYVNAYEEENSPFEQRRKFIQQRAFQVNTAGTGEEGFSEVGMTIDEGYLEALEWGMPPTGGWGCGLDRLVMLFGGKKRIADVLPFGTLRNVANLSRGK